MAEATTGLCPLCEMNCLEWRAKRLIRQTGLNEETTVMRHRGRASLYRHPVGLNLTYLTSARKAKFRIESWERMPKACECEEKPCG